MFQNCALTCGFNLTKFANFQFETCLRNEHFTERYTHCQSETCFCLAHISERHAACAVVSLIWPRLGHNSVNHKRKYDVRCTCMKYAGQSGTIYLSCHLLIFPWLTISSFVLFRVGCVCVFTHQTFSFSVCISGLKVHILSIHTDFNSEEVSVF